LNRIYALLPAVLTASCISVGHSAPAIRPASLCEQSESVVFECITHDEKVALCGKAEAGNRSIAYRFGDNEEIVETGMANSHFSYAMRGYSGGGEAQVQVRKDDDLYLIYDRVVRTGFGADGLNKPEFTSGVATFHRGAVISNHICQQPFDNPLQLNELEKYMSKGDFVATP